MTANIKPSIIKEMNPPLVSSKINGPKGSEIRSAASTTRSSIHGKLTPGFNDLSLEGYLKKIRPDGGIINLNDAISVNQNLSDFGENCKIVDKQPFDIETTTKLNLPSKESNCIGLGLLPSQCELLARKKGETFTLMVAGRASTGKTTFINTLFGTQLIESTLNGGTTTNISINKFKLIENGFQLNLTTIDTPGFGNKINNKFNWIPICNFIDEQFRNYLFQLEQPDRTKLVDNRVHCCLYFIELNGSSLTPLDIILMQHISKRVNLIPVISKSDILSKQELNQFKILIKHQLKFHKINICELILDDFVRDKIYESIPFAIIGTNNFDNKPLSRKYIWGTVDIENNSNCDYLLLKKVLLSENMLDLISSTESCFDNYRLECLELRLQQANLSNKTNDGKMSTYSGFDQLKLYNQIGLQKFIELKQNNVENVFEIRQDDVKDKLGSYVFNEELRFKNWKKNLVEKQNELNKDIEIQHKKMVSLQKLVEGLENGSNGGPPQLETFPEEEKPSSN